MDMEQLAITILVLAIIVGIMLLLIICGSVRDLEMRVFNNESRIDAILKRMRSQDKAIEELSRRIDGGTDVITNIQNDYDKLKKNAERTHLIALQAFNDMNRYNVRGKHVRKAQNNEGNEVDSMQ